MTQVLRVGPLEIRPDQGLVVADGHVVPMSVRELDLLTALVESKGSIVRRADLYVRAWGRELRAGDRTVDVYVHKLRAKLEDALPGHRFIHTHVGFGYRFEHHQSPPPRVRAARDGGGDRAAPR